jgi:hypothetical protein
MPGLFLPRFRPTEAIDARQIDRCAQSIAEVLNGGLTADNFGPDSGFAVDQFVENRGVYALKAFVNSAHTVDGSLNANSIFGVIPYASSIIGVGYALKYTSFAQTRQLDIMGGASGSTLLYRHLMPRRGLPVLIGATQYLIGFIQPRLPEVVAAGSILRIIWPTAASSLPVGCVTLFLSSAWRVV